MWHRGKHKFNAVPTVVNGIRFMSKREAARYGELSLMEKAGRIQGLVLQPTFKFPCGIKYKADFQYTENNQLVTEDVKGF